MLSHEWKCGGLLLCQCCSGRKYTDEMQGRRRFGAGSRHVRASVVSAGDASSQRSFTALSAKATAAIQALVTGQSQSILVHLAAAGSASARLKGITQPTGGGGGSGRNISAKLIKARQRNLPEFLVKGNQYDILLIFFHVGLSHEIGYGQETKIN